MDFSDITDALSFAKNLGQTYNGVRPLIRDLVGAAKTDKAPSQAIADIEARLSVEVFKMEAQLQTLEAKIRLAEIQLENVDELKSLLASYELHRTPAGTFVYKPKDADPSDQACHFACTDCYTDRKHSILQREGYMLVCQKCGFQVLETEPPGLSF